MAINVTTNYYSIDVPEEYQRKADDLALIAALAKRLDMEELYNQSKKAFMDLYNRWDKEGSALAKKKSSTNWLGAGSIYMARPMMPWDFCCQLGEAFVGEMPIEDCAKTLKKMLSNE